MRWKRHPVDICSTHMITDPGWREGGMNEHKIDLILWEIDRKRGRQEAALIDRWNE